MNGHWEKYLSSNELQSLESVRYLPMRKSELKRKLYRKAYHRQHRQKVNETSKRKYHDVYKQCSTYKQRQQQYNKHYRLRKGPAWERRRNLKYRKSYSELSEKQRESIRAHCREWTKLNWEKRVSYARNWRSKQSTFGLRKAIISARRTGDVRELARICELAIARTHEKSRKQRGQSVDGKRRVQMRE